MVSFLLFLMFINTVKNMNKNKSIVGIFVNKSKILSTIEKIHNKIGIPINRIFLYKIYGNEVEYLLTFVLDKTAVSKNMFKNAAILHIKNDCLFSINALNKLIEKEKGDLNIINTNFQLNWDKFKGYLVILTKGQLSLYKILKIENKNILFSSL